MKTPARRRPHRHPRPTTTPSTSTPRLLHRRAGSRRGAAAVEFAIAGPILFLIVLGIFQFGGMMVTDDSLSASFVDPSTININDRGIASASGGGGGGGGSFRIVQ